MNAELRRSSDWQIDEEMLNSIANSSKVLMEASNEIERLEKLCEDQSTHINKFRKVLEECVNVMAISAASRRILHIDEPVLIKALNILSS